MLREYIWLGWEPIALVQGGAVQAGTADHIYRPTFATNAAWDVVWAQSYDPFGRVVSGASSDTRFAGQWFAAENGLHQNWMRDYDATLGSYIQVDPLGMVDGASVYGYALQNPSPVKPWPSITLLYPNPQPPQRKSAAGFPAAPKSAS